MQENVKKIKYLQNKFRNDLSILQKTKDGFLRLFRSKLEEKKIEQIKGSILINNNSYTE